MTNGNWRNNPAYGSKDDIAKEKDGEWIAGRDAEGYAEGETVPEDYAKRARSQREFQNTVKGIQHNQGLDYDEARDLAAELRDRMEGADPDEVRDIRNELLGYE